MSLLSALNADDLDTLGNKMFKVCDQLTSKQKITDNVTYSHMKGIITGASMFAIVAGGATTEKNADGIVLTLSCVNSYNTHKKGTDYYAEYIIQVMKSVQSLYAKPSL